jgi:hypothetical protein
MTARGRAVSFLVGDVDGVGAEGGEVGFSGLDVGFDFGTGWLAV